MTRAVILVLVLVGLAGCASPAPAATHSDLRARVAALAAVATGQDSVRDDLVAQCMRRQGFEVDVAAAAATTPTSSLPPDEFRSRYGYGITTVGVAGEGAAAAVPTPGSGAGPDADSTTNWRTTSEREAYLAAMYGPEGQEPPTQGCFNEASRAAFAGLDTFVTRYGDRLTRLARDVEQDREVVEATIGWSRCMAAAGFAYVTPSAIGPSLAERLAAIDTGDSSALTRLQVEERATASADWRCADAGLSRAVDRAYLALEAGLEAEQSSLLSDLEAVTGTYR